jgi:hypothetical protein
MVRHQRTCQSNDRNRDVAVDVADADVTDSSPTFTAEAARKRTKDNYRQLSCHGSMH